MANLYRHFDSEGNLLYIGISHSALVRLTRHAYMSPWFREIKRVEIETFPTRQAAARAEKRAIRKERPRYNVMFKKKNIRKPRPTATKGGWEMGEKWLAYFRRQGKQGGLARAAALTPERRSEIARTAVAAREARRLTKTKSSP